MLFDGEHFIQHIEGSTAAIRQLMDNIRRDARHEQVQVLVDEPLQQIRRCADWRMGYVDCEDTDFHTRLQQAAAGQILQQFEQDIRHCELL